MDTANDREMDTGQPEPDESGERRAYFTFGWGQAHHVQGITFDPDCMVEVVADDPRAAMFAMFGQKWGFEYDEPVPRFAPRGIVARITGARGSYSMEAVRDG